MCIGLVGGWLDESVFVGLRCVCLDTSVQLWQWGGSIALFERGRGEVYAANGLRTWLPLLERSIDSWAYVCH